MTEDQDLNSRGNLEKLKRKRNDINERLARVLTFAENFSLEQNINLIKTRQNAICGALDEFHKIQEAIEDLVPIADLPAEQKKKIEFEEQYFDTLALLQSLVDEQNSRTAIVNVPNSTSTPINNQNLKINLPVIQIPEFDGNFEKWLSYRDIFHSLIHSNTNLNNTEKMHYLKSSLSGDALRAIENLSVSSSNYIESWEILEERFGKKRLIIQSHIRKIINTPSIVKCTPSALRQLLDDVRSNLASLKALNRPINEWDDILVTLIPDKLDNYSNREWQSTLKSNEMPTCQHLLDFLEKRCQYLESVSHKTNVIKQSPQIKPFRLQSVSNNATSKGRSCLLCKKSNHSLYQCNNFLKLNVGDRIKQVTALNLCKNCLRDNHTTKDCVSTNICRECNARHNTLLHVKTSDISIKPTGPSTSTVGHCSSKYSENLLSTAIIHVMDANGKPHNCRVLLDSGSQSHFITKELCTKLGLSTKKIRHQLIGINMICSNDITQMAEVNIKSRFSNYSSKIDCLVSEKITQNLPLVSFPVDDLIFPKNIKLADENFNRSSKIDLLIGSQIFLQLLREGSLRLQPYNLHLQNTVFGYIIGGELNTMEKPTHTSGSFLVNSQQMQDLNNQVTKFWQIESPEFYDGIRASNELQPSQKDTNDVEKHFQNTYSRTPEGRFVVSLPARNNVIQLGNSINMAKRRFLNLEKKLIKDHELYKNYKQFMQEYERLGHMERVPEDELQKTDVYYIPHFAIFKNSNFRVVFDASARTSNNLSLNDNLLAGPTIQEDLFSILTRFRTFNIVLKADIKKMYRQIVIDPDQKDYQRILWRENENEPLQIYRLLTVTYGVNSSPFLAIRCLQQLAMDFQNKFPEASDIIMRNFYVDDVLVNCNSTTEALILKEELQFILKSGGFELTKWASNDPTILSDIQIKSDSDESINLDKDYETKTLGLFWNCKNDSLKYKIDTIKREVKITKRYILSTICKCFDPLGLVGPIIIRAKLLLQQLWKVEIGWDQVVPSDISNTWLQIIDDLQALNNIEIPRKVITLNSINISLHGFADSSEKAYGAALYLKCVNADNVVHTQLLIAKSRVAPLKVITIPRLELLAALLLSKLYKRILDILDITFHDIYLYSDSTIVLAWLAKPADTWKTFVANRISQIQSLTQNVKWRHVKTSENPADLLSRGSSTNNLLKSELWWHGPSFLHHDPETFEAQTDKLNIEELTELPEARKKTTISNTVTNKKPCEIFIKFSDFVKMKKCFAYILRFIHNCKNKTEKRSNSLTVDEVQGAHDKIIQLIQSEIFSQELQQLKANQSVHKTSSLATLNPFLDKKGIIRVGGRLRHAKLSYDKKYPIVLPKNHHVTKLLIRHFHLVHLHAGGQATLTAIRQMYWIISGRRVVRSVLRKCITCFKARPTISQQQMGDLPYQRLQQIRPFLKTGVDYCGPILIKENRGRGKKAVKAYIALFICLCSKAVHLELVTDLSTEGFLNALRRFVSRRGSVREIHSDNATNFVGANRELQELKLIFENQHNKEKLISTLASQNIVWHFIPPRAPNFAGLWESNIKQVKTHLKKVIGDTILTYEEMYTYLTRIEACLNSRPLTPLTNDPNDLDVLTPGHFLIGEPITAPVEPDLSEIKLNRLSRWQLIEKMRQHFWKRWQKEYVSQLQVRNKWRSASTAQLRPGTMVLIAEDNIPPLHWPLGRVQEVHPGKDGLVRVVTLRTNKGVYKRAISKICVLPIDDNTV